MALWEAVYDEFVNGRSVPFTKTLNKNQLASHVDLYSDHNLARWGYGVDAKPVYPQKNKEDYLLDFDRKYTVGNLGCAFCPVQCQKNYSVPGGDSGGCACFVNMTCRWTVKNFDTHVWWKTIARLQRYGMDSLEITGIVGWLMLLYQGGYISAEDTDGVPMEWGSERAILTVIDRIALQQGFGTYFKGGIINASKTMVEGKGYELALHDRNIAVPIDIYPDRGVMTLGVGGNQLMRAATQLLWYEPHVDRYALYQLFAEEMGIPEQEALALQERWLAEFAEKHTGKRNSWKPDAVEGKASYVAAVENAIAASDIAGRCDGSSSRLPHCGYTWDVEHIARAISVATGDECSTERLLDVIQKKRLLETSYNILCETMIGDFPEITEANIRMFNDPVKDGFFEGSAWDEEGCERAGADYCGIRGCDPSTGIPTRKELDRLGLGYVADKLGEFGFDLDPELSEEVHSNEWR
jgi:aldehyde:ferredoxin oxidoreductase